jgi:tellurite resistance protein
VNGNGDTCAIPPTKSRPRVPLNTLAIPLGLAGLAQVWTETGHILGWPEGVADVFWVVAAMAWVVTIVWHTVRGRESADSFVSQLVQPVQGPLAALFPIVAMLLAAVLFRFWPAGGIILVTASIIVAGLYAGWIVGHWMRGGLQLSNVHGGYILPTVAASYIASGAASAVGMHDLAAACFGIGCFLWPIIFALELARLAFTSPLPAALTPTTMILLAPPAAAGAAWFGLNGGHADDVALSLAAITVLMALVEAGLLRIYWKLPFSIGFWAFTFPVAYAAAYTLAWLNIVRPGATPAIAIAILVGVTALLVAIAYKSVALALSGRRGATRAVEQQLHSANTAASAGPDQTPPLPKSGAA